MSEKEDKEEEEEEGRKKSRRQKGRKERRRRLLEPNGQPILAKLMSSRFSEKLYLKNQGNQPMRKTVDNELYPLHACTGTYACYT